MDFSKCGTSRRKFLSGSVAALLISLPFPFVRRVMAAISPPNPVFWIKNIPNDPFSNKNHPNYHTGVEGLLRCMGSMGLKLYNHHSAGPLSSPTGIIRSNDLVLIKVNAQWKYRGCTNSDLVRGLIQRILDHPGRFTGEVVIIENGQGRGSLNCDTSARYGGDGTVHANANNESHTFAYLVDELFNDSRVSYYLLDNIGGTFIEETDHVTDGYRKFGNISYPCFTTAGGHRIELREGVWQGSFFSQNLKLINVPVLKHHDEGGSEITASLKHFYGILSMADGNRDYRHFTGLGRTCGRMIASVRTPVLNIIDAIWVSHLSLTGYPSNTTFRANQIMAGQDPVALDYCAAKYILFSIDQNPRHHPSFSGINSWLTSACDTINRLGGLSHRNSGILLSWATKEESKMMVHEGNAGTS
jgi:hypothetical protein